MGMAESTHCPDVRLRKPKNQQFTFEESASTEASKRLQATHDDPVMRAGLHALLALKQATRDRLFCVVFRFSGRAAANDASDSLEVHRVENSASRGLQQCRCGKAGRPVTLIFTYCVQMQNIPGHVGR